MGSTVSKSAGKPQLPPVARKLKDSLQARKLEAPSLPHRKKPSPQPEKFIMSNYKIIRLIGSGGFGTVHLAHNPKSDKYCAVKVIDAPNARMMKHAMREVRVHGMVNHVNIAGYLGSFKHSTKVLLYMELLHQNLSGLIRQMPPMSVNLSLFFFEQIVTGLEYLHMHGLCHRDIKVENLLVKSDGTIKLCDFGLADEVVDADGQEIKHRLRAGSYRNMAPEVFSQQKSRFYYGPPTDIWSAAIVFFYFITESYPWSKPTLKDRRFNRWYDKRDLGTRWKKMSTQGTRTLMDAMLRVTPKNRLDATDIIKWIRSKLLKPHKRWSQRVYVTNFIKANMAKTRGVTE